MIILTKSPNPNKKFRALFVNEGKHVDFGAKGYSDYTIHKDRNRMKRYLERHGRMGEDWTTKTGKYTAGFWSRWLLWNRPSIGSAIASVSRRLRRPIQRRF